MHCVALWCTEEGDPLPDGSPRTIDVTVPGVPCVPCEYGTGALDDAVATGPDGACEGLHSVLMSSMTVADTDKSVCEVADTSRECTEEGCHGVLVTFKYAMAGHEASACELLDCMCRLAAWRPPVADC